MDNFPDGSPPKRSNFPMEVTAFGAAMLLLGLAAGFFARPLLTPAADKAPTAATPMVVVVTAPPQVVVVTPTSDPAGPAPQPTVAEQPSGADPVAAATAMVAVTERVRHFKGEADAKVVILEFSDFQ